MRVWACLCVVLACGQLAMAQAPTTQPGFKPGFMFSDNLVLQRDKPAPVWGEALPGTTVTVTLAGKTATAVADASGQWKATLAPTPAGGPFELTISAAGDQRIIKNVLVGDVWLCSGQSNMWWSVKMSKDGKAEIAQASHPKIRLMTIPQRGGRSPERDLTGAQWEECSPETIPDFSALAYYFGRDLQQQHGVPIGLINSSWGGSAVASWTSLKWLETNPDFAGHLLGYHDAMSSYDRDLSAGLVDEDGYYLDKGLQSGEKNYHAADLDDSKWPEMDLPKSFNTYGKPLYVFGAVWFRKTVDIPQDWAGQDLTLALGNVVHYDMAFFNGTLVGNSDREAFANKTASASRQYTIPGKLVKAGQNLIAVRVFDKGGNGGILGFAEWQKRPIALELQKGKTISLAGAWKYKPGNPLPPKAIAGWRRTHHLPSSTFNAMIAPISPYSLRGVLWYQGEQNQRNAWEYRALFPALIQCWREAFAAPELPFVFVQLPTLGAPAKEPHDDLGPSDSWAEVRLAQAMALKLPNTGMVVTIDNPEPNTIHPSNKQWLATRCALAARAVAYGEKVAYSGPLYASHEIEAGKVRVRFTHATGGLVAKDSPDGTLKGFAIAGADRKFVWAQARVDGQTVVIWSDEVPEPVSVSYAFANNPAGCNLFNADGLPAAPFRTDTWTARTTGRKFPY